MVTQKEKDMILSVMNRRWITPTTIQRRLWENGKFMKIKSPFDDVIKELRKENLIERKEAKGSGTWTDIWLYRITETEA